jgi:hypothetical protein
MCSSLWFPKVQGVAAGVIGKWPVSNLQLSKDYKRNPPVLVQYVEIAAQAASRYSDKLSAG